ncbi:NUDIX hydrolase [Rubritalea tangerina]
MGCMMRLIRYLFFSTMLFCGVIEAAGPAGIVLYFKSGEEVYLLLADDVVGQRGWSAFGGGANEGESTEETAAREASEETRGFYQKADLLELIRGQKPVVSHGYTMYFAEVPYAPAIRIQQHPLENKLAVWNYEKRYFAWVPLSDLERALKDEDPALDPLYLPAKSPKKEYWNVWLRSVKAAYAQKACPWQ